MDLDLALDASEAVTGRTSDSGKKPDRLWRAVGSGDDFDAVALDQLVVRLLGKCDDLLEALHRFLGVIGPNVLEPRDVLLDAVKESVFANANSDAFVSSGNINGAPMTLKEESDLLAREADVAVSKDFVGHD
jgi:hypothetical protein